MERKYFEINGYWKERALPRDGRVTFEGYIVTNYDGLEEGGKFSEDDIFFYGMEESDIIRAIEKGENTGDDFVITSYEEIIMGKTKQFPNGFDSWQETHFEVVSAITYIARLDTPYGVVAQTDEERGTGGLYELAEELTDKFEKMHEGREWEGEFFEEIEEFLINELR